MWARVTVTLASVSTLNAMTLCVPAASQDPVGGVSPSFGTLLECSTPSADGSVCVWQGKNGQRVDRETLEEQAIREFSRTGSANANTTAQVNKRRRLLRQELKYIEEVERYANQIGHRFSYRLGVNPRHLDVSPRRVLPHLFVEREKQAQHRRLVSRGTSSSSSSSSSFGSSSSSTPTPNSKVSIPTTLNWCSQDNPQRRNVCTIAKNQHKCGSCWAFAAADAIEAAVSISSGREPRQLSAQQFLSCSTRASQLQFQYCWVSNTSTSTNGPNWLHPTVTWKSENTGCDGGMTVNAYLDAAQLHFNLVDELTMPYLDGQGGAASKERCDVPVNHGAATISGWEQGIGPDCSSSRDPSVLLKEALQKQPLSVAMSSSGAFNNYKSGLYNCPNDGVLPDRASVNHAMLLVGYGHDETEGDYWIVKNSYGTEWGELGFMRLLADDKANCGLNIFAVRPTGAKRGNSKIHVDSGGEQTFMGLSYTSCLLIAEVVCVVTLISTLLGVYCWRRRLQQTKR